MPITQTIEPDVDRWQQLEPAIEPDVDRWQQLEPPQAYRASGPSGPSQGHKASEPPGPQQAPQDSGPPEPPRAYRASEPPEPPHAHTGHEPPEPPQEHEPGKPLGARTLEPAEVPEPTGGGPLAHLSAAQLEQLGHELDAIRDEVLADLGEADARYIRDLIRRHRQLVVGARALLAGAGYKPLWLLGTSMLSLAKVLENMEIGHNVMHGQWDWMNDPDINSRTWDWDTASPADAWRHSHNYEHHTFTNIRGKDRDLGYEIMRIDPHQPWHPVYLLQPLYNLLLMGFFEWGVALHDLNYEAIQRGEKSKAQVLRELKAIGAKARRQIVKDYLAFPLLSALAAAAAGRTDGAQARARRAFKTTFAANFTANIVRNVWAHSIIFCGHFPDGTYTFSQQEAAEETRGGWYARQLLGSANIDGSPLFHLLSGNLSFQIEHHLYPDIPSNRYQRIAPRVRALCERYGLPYNSGPLGQQLGSVHRTIVRLAFPSSRRRRGARRSPRQG